MNPVAMLGAIAPGGNDGFQPFPIGIMPPFLEYQNAVTARSFFMSGAISKRMVKALSNEQFNKEFKNNFQDLRAWQEQQNRLDREMFYRSLEAANEVQKKIIDEGIKVELAKIDGKIRLWKEMPSAYWDAIANNATKLDNKLFDGLTPQEASVSSQGTYNPTTNTSTSSSTSSTPTHNIVLEEKPQEEKPEEVFTGNPNIESTPYSESNPKIDPDKRVKLVRSYYYMQNGMRVTKNFINEATMKDHMTGIKALEKKISDNSHLGGVWKANQLGRLTAWRTEFRLQYGFYA
jgi:hypothetical protein